jgi:hypothetical protein
MAKAFGNTGHSNKSASRACGKESQFLNGNLDSYN